MRQLTLRNIRVRAVNVPMRRPLATSTGAVATAPLALIDVETEEGVTGHAYLFCIHPVSALPLRDLTSGLFAFVKGDRLAPLDIERKLRARLTLLGNNGLANLAVAGIDMACWDALARAAGVPLVSLLGGAPRPIRAYNSTGLGLMPPAAAAEEARALLDEGFSAIKIRLGRDDPSADLAAVRAVRAAVPSATVLMSDYNQRLSVNDAILRGRALDDEGLFWIEEPVRQDDHIGCARVAAALDTPVQLGENFQGPVEMGEALALHASDYVMPDVQRIGGVSGWLRAAALAHAVGIEMSSHLFPEISAHLLAVTPTCHWLEFVDWASPILARPTAVERGHVTPGDAPGTGVEWDEDAVAKYLVT